MRRKIRVWLVITLIGLLLTPPALATYEMMEEGNLRIIGGFRTGTEVRYDLDVFAGPSAPFHVDDYYEIRIHEPETLTWIDGTERMVVRVVEIERHSKLPLKIEQPKGDATEEHWFDAVTMEPLGTRTTEKEWFGEKQGWEGQETIQTRRGPSASLHALRTDFVLYDAPLNTTWPLKVAKKIDTLENVHAAHRAAVVDGVPVLGRLQWLSHTSLPAPCSMPTLAPSPWEKGDVQRDSWVHAWYDQDVPFPLRFDCTSHRDGGEVYAATTRTHLTITGTPLTFQRGTWGPDGPHTSAEPFTMLPPEKHPVLPYPLHDAHDAVTSDPELTEFQGFRQRSDAYVLVGARFAVDQVSNPPPSMILPVPLPEKVEDAVARGTWSLHYVSENGEEIRLRTSRPLHGPGAPENVEREVEEANLDAIGLFATLDSLKLVPLDTAVRQAVADGVPFDGTIGDHFSFWIGYGLANGQPRLDPEYSVGSWADGGGLQRDYDGRSGSPEAVYETTRGTAPPPQPQSEPASASAFTHRTTDGVVAGTAAVAGASAVVFALLQGKALLGLFHAKIARSRVLDHPRREELHEYLRTNPGASLRATQEALGLGWGSTIHHLGTLERNGFITSRRSGRHRRFWLREDKPLAQIKKEALLAEPTPRRIVEMLAVEPGLSQADLARRLGLARSTVHHHVTKLAAAGLLPPPPQADRQKSGRPTAPTRPRHT